MGGFSTSMLVMKMKAAAQSMGIDVEIDAVAETELEKYSDLNIILLGPQVGHMLDDVKSRFDIPVLVINSMDYGLMNGEKVLQDAMKHIS